MGLFKPILISFGDLFPRSKFKISGPNSNTLIPFPICFGMTNFFFCHSSIWKRKSEVWRRGYFLAYFLFSFSYSPFIWKVSSSNGGKAVWSWPIWFMFHSFWQIHSSTGNVAALQRYTCYIICLNKSSNNWWLQIFYLGGYMQLIFENKLFYSSLLCPLRCFTTLHFRVLYYCNWLATSNPFLVFNACN